MSGPDPYGTCAQCGAQVHEDRVSEHFELHHNEVQSVAESEAPLPSFVVYTKGQGL